MTLTDKPIGLGVPGSDHAAIVMTISFSITADGPHVYSTHLARIISVLLPGLLEQTLANEGHMRICQGNVEPVVAMASHSCFIKCDKGRSTRATKRAAPDATVHYTPVEVC